MTRKTPARARPRRARGKKRGRRKAPSHPPSRGARKGAGGEEKPPGGERRRRTRCPQERALPAPFSAHLRGPQAPARPTTRQAADGRGEGNPRQARGPGRGRATARPGAARPSHPGTGPGAARAARPAGVRNKRGYHKRRDEHVLDASGAGKAARSDGSPRRPAARASYDPRRGGRGQA